VEKATMGSEEKVVASSVAPENEEATEAWSGVLFDRFVQYRELIVEGLAGFGEVAMQANPPAPGDRVLDVGCGFGDASQQLASLVGPDGEVVGIDVSEPFVEASIEEAKQAGVENVDFIAGDVQVMDLGGPFDYAFSRMGVMFFANPVQAFRNIRGALRPGGRLVAVVWRRKLRQRVGPPDRAGGRAVSGGTGGDRRANLRPWTLLDGERRHSQRAAADRRV
jgi:SAM-dependent methyltransferase